MVSHQETLRWVGVVENKIHRKEEVAGMEGEYMLGMKERAVFLAFFWYWLFDHQLWANRLYPILYQ